MPIFAPIRIEFHPPANYPMLDPLVRRKLRELWGAEIRTICPPDTAHDWNRALVQTDEFAKAQPLLDALVRKEIQIVAGNRTVVLADVPPDKWGYVSPDEHTLTKFVEWKEPGKPAEAFPMKVTYDGKDYVATPKLTYRMVRTRP